MGKVSRAVQGVQGRGKGEEITMTQELLNDCQRLLGCEEARIFLNNMSKTTFYRNIKRGVIPKQRYLGCTPVWRLNDLHAIYENLPQKPAGG
jgi:predicted DNA-binding transcriptional regulator AlpA